MAAACFADIIIFALATIYGILIGETRRTYILGFKHLQRSDILFQIRLK